MNSYAQKISFDTYYEERHKADEALGCMIPIAVGLLAVFSFVKLVEILIAL